jgi:predicted kinase
MLADAGGWVLLSSDRVRKGLANIPASIPAPAAYGQGIYAPPMTERTYATLLDRAQTALRRGESVVLDATWLQPGWRARARQLAETTTSDLVEICCHAPAAVSEARLGQRVAGAADSDATILVRSMMAANAPAWPEAVELDTSQPLDITLRRALRLAGLTTQGLPLASV